MPNDKTHITKGASSLFKKSLVGLFFLIFVNFTFAIQYVNLSDFNMTLTEIVEEEEKEEHRNDLLELLVNNSNAIQVLKVELKKPIIKTLVTEVFTPPPELS
jgi:hypothetical protein